MTPLPDIGPEEIDRLEISEAQAESLERQAALVRRQGLPGVMLSVHVEHVRGLLADRRAQARRTVTAEAERDEARASKERLHREMQGRESAVKHDTDRFWEALLMPAIYIKARLRKDEVQAKFLETLERATRAEAEAAALREKVERLEAENATLSRSVRMQENGDDGCPFDNPRYERAVDDPCPICGDLGRGDGPSRCISRPVRRAAALLPTPDAGTGEER